MDGSNDTTVPFWGATLVEGAENKVEVRPKERASHNGVRQVFMSSDH